LLPKQQGLTPRVFVKKNFDQQLNEKIHSSTMNLTPAVSVVFSKIKIYRQLYLKKWVILDSTLFYCTLIALLSKAYERGFYVDDIRPDPERRYRVVFRVAESMGIAPDEVPVFGKSPRNVKARALMCHWAHLKLGITATEIARRLKIGRSAVSRLWRRGEQIANECGINLTGG
jgi:hypothetical protein